MKIAVFSSQPYERPLLDAANAHAGHDLSHLDASLTLLTAPLAAGCPALSIFLNDNASAPVLERLALRVADIVTLHCPLTPATRHLVNADTLATMKHGRDADQHRPRPLVDAVALIEALKRGHVGFVGLDVYEEEADLFFRDLSDVVITDDVFMRLLTFPNVVITAHQAVFTHEAVAAIAHTTIDNVSGFAAGAPPERARVRRVA